MLSILCKKVYNLNPRRKDTNFKLFVTLCLCIFAFEIIKKLAAMYLFLLIA